MLEASNIHFVHQIADLCRQAGSAILHYYQQSNIDIRSKSDHTPVTEADIRAHHILSEGLISIYPMPLISEENIRIPDITAVDEFWLIDPLDGTYEFLKGTDGFCINIAHIRQHRPYFSMIYAPVSHECWFAFSELGAYKLAGKEMIRIHSQAAQTPPRIITSSAPMSTKMADFIDKHIKDYRHCFAGGAIKFCHLAEGLAEYYFKLSARTSEWDTAAGDLILHEAGGVLRFAPNQLPRYGTKLQMTNPPFIAASHIDEAQLQYLFQAIQALPT